MSKPTEPPALSPRLLVWLASITGASFDETRAGEAIRNANLPGITPAELLANAAKQLFMHADSEWMPLKDAVWRARRDTPVVLRSATPGRWIVVTHAGWFRVRIADSSAPEERRTVSREQLARMLGVTSISEVVEATVIDPEYHSRNIRDDEAEAGAHGDTHHSSLSPLRRFLGFLSCEKQDIVTFLIYSVFAAILYLGAPLAVDALVSGLAFGGQSQPYIQAIVILSLALAACLVLHGLVNAFLYYISEMIQRRIFVRTAADLAHRLPRVDTAELDDVHTPEVVNRFLDIVTLQKSVAILLLEGVNLGLSTLFGMVLLALFHPYLMLVVLVMVVSIVVILRFLGGDGVKSSIRESHMKYDLVNCFEEIAHFPFLFKGPGGREFAIRRANTLVTGYVNARARHFRVIMRQIAGLLVLQVFAGAGLLVIGGYLVLNQQITLGQLVASELIMSAIIASLGKLGKKIEAWYDAIAAVDKLGHIIDLPVERTDGERPAKPSGPAAGCSVVVKDLAFGYHGDHRVFSGKTFSIRPGERVALTGPHGSGASTLLDILFALREPSAGFVAVDGVDVRGWSLDAYRDEVQLLRRNEIVEGTVIENLRLGRDDIGADELRDALAKVGLLDSLRLRPEGLSTHLKIGGAPLSGSQRTRLLLARALVHRPRLVLLDELLDGLDEKSFREVVPAIFDRSLPWTLVVATRDAGLIARCDRVIALAPGEHSARGED